MITRHFLAMYDETNLLGGWADSSWAVVSSAADQDHRPASGERGQAARTMLAGCAEALEERVASLVERTTKAQGELACNTQRVEIS